MAKGWKKGLTLLWEDPKVHIKFYILDRKKWH